jgi:hypothetical protein
VAEDPYIKAGARPVTSGGEIRGPGYATAQQKSLADLTKTYADIDAQRRRLDMDQARLNRLLKEPVPEAPKPAVQKTREAMMETRGKVIGTKAAEQEFALPKVEQSVSRAFQTAQELMKHPGFEAATGLPNPFKGGFGVGNIPGTPAGDYATTLKTATAEAFMPAFEALKGAGAISEREGAAAAASLANLGTDMSEAQFKRELQKYVDKLATGLDVARKQAAMGGSPFTYEDLMREKRRRAEMKGPR